VPNTGACYIEWPVLAASVTVSTDYMISMTVTLDDRLRGYFSGFFTTSLQAPADMLARGFKVNCGAPGAAGNPDLGASYRYLIEARATSGPVTQISGDVSCPADLLHLQLPFLTR
jgi:hypothetical protein